MTDRDRRAKPDIDSDGDGLSDHDEETVFLTDPLAVDSDGDGLSDAEEIFETGTDPWDADSR